jgi:hypothetical protein
VGLGFIKNKFAYGNKPQNTTNSTLLAISGIAFVFGGICLTS